MASRPKNPDATTSRPSEPIRPLPARQAGISLMAVQVRRRRYTHDLPRRSR